MNSIRLPLVVAALIAAPFVHAEEKAKTATLRCRVFAIGSAPAGDVYVKAGGKFRKIDVSTDFISASVRIEATKEGVVFFKKQPSADAKGKDEKDSYTPIAFCQPDGSATRQLIFFFPGASPNTWVVRAKSDVDTAFPPGSRLVFNISDSTVGMDFGGTKLTVPPRGAGLLQAPKSAPDGMAPVKIGRQSKAGAWTPFISSVWRQSTDERNILLIYPVAGSEDLALSCIQDTVEPPDAEEKAPEKKP